eukprot:1436293-Pyramimonas_sp.AAC.1
MSRQYGTDEEQFVLRVPNDVADRIRRVLRNSPDMRPEDANMELNFFGKYASQQLSVQDFLCTPAYHRFVLAKYCT